MDELGKSRLLHNLPLSDLLEWSTQTGKHVPQTSTTTRQGTSWHITFAKHRTDLVVKDGDVLAPGKLFSTTWLLKHGGSKWKLWSWMPRRLINRLPPYSLPALWLVVPNLNLEGLQQLSRARETWGKETVCSARRTIMRSTAWDGIHSNRLHRMWDHAQQTIGYIGCEITHSKQLDNLRMTIVFTITVV